MTPIDTNPYETGLDKNPANFMPLSPIGFLARSAAVYPDRLAVAYGERRYSWRQALERCRRLAGALAARGVGRGDTVALLAPNIPEAFEAHFGVPMAGAVLNALNIRLDPETIAFILRPRRGQGADRRQRIRAGDRSGAGPARPEARRHRHRRRGGAGRRAARRDRIRGLSRRAATRPSRKSCPRTNGRRSPSIIPRAPPATRRASSITTAAPI